VALEETVIDPPWLTTIPRAMNSPKPTLVGTSVSPDMCRTSGSKIDR
jgi:hypothetical protein